MIIIHNDNSNNRDKIPWREFQQTHLDSAVIHQQSYWKSSRNLAELQPDKRKTVNSFSALGQSIPARLCNTFSYYLPVADKAFAYDAMSYNSKKYEIYGDCKSSFMVYRSGTPPPFPTRPIRPLRSLTKAATNPRHLTAMSEHHSQRAEVSRDRRYE